MRHDHMTQGQLYGVARLFAAAAEHSRRLDIDNVFVDENLGCGYLDITVQPGRTYRATLRCADGYPYATRDVPAVFVTLTFTADCFYAGDYDPSNWCGYNDALYDNRIAFECVVPVFEEERTEWRGLSAWITEDFADFFSDIEACISRRENMQTLAMDMQEDATAQRSRGGA